MRLLLKVSSVICLTTSLLLLLSLLDVFAFPTLVHRLCGGVCLVSLFLMTYSRVWLISYRRKQKHK